MGYAMATINVGGTFQHLLDIVVRIVPRIIVFVIILVIGWIVAKLIERAVAIILERTHFNRWAQRGVVGKALERSEYDAARLIGRLFFYAVLLIALEVAFNVFGRNPISDILRAIVAWLPRLAVAVIIIVIASAIAHAVKDIVGAALSAVSYGRVLANAAAAFIIVLGVIAALNQIGIATTVTEPVLITGLATIGAILAIGIGGGLIKPMQQRWERMLSAGERDAGTVRSSAYQRGREDAMRGEGVPTEEGRQHERPGAPGGPGTGTPPDQPGGPPQGMEP